MIREYQNALPGHPRTPSDGWPDSTVSSLPMCVTLLAALGGQALWVTPRSRPPQDIGTYCPSRVSQPVKSRRSTRVEMARHTEPYLSKRSGFHQASMSGVLNH